MRVLALDLGTNMAAAWGDTPSHGGTAHFVAGGPKAKRPEKLANIHKWLVSFLISPGSVDAVVFERPFARGQGATRMLWGIAGIIEAVAHESGVAVIDLPPASIKKWATGSGKASKEDMLDAARGMGYIGSNEHEADAYCLLQYALSKIKVLPNGKN